MTEKLFTGTLNYNKKKNNQEYACRNCPKIKNNAYILGRFSHVGKKESKLARLLDESCFVIVVVFV